MMTSSAQAMELVTRGGKRLAVFGIVNVTPSLKSFDIDNDVFFADINWNVLRAAVRKLKISYTELS
jgi:phenylalanyl-tRNA synthetase beta chain